jgi:hypothetical protein
MADDKDSKWGINKEFIPILFLLATPMLAYMNGFAVRTASLGVDVYYITAMAFGVIMSVREKIAISDKYEFVLLILLEIAVNIPYMKSDNYFNGNYAYLYISYGLIVMFFLASGISFFINKPYFIDYYTTEKTQYLVMYRIVSVFFLAVVVFHVYLFTKVIAILKMTYQ